jgi:putative ABC transport system permease protein
MIRIGGEESEPMEVIGVVSDLRQYGRRYRPLPAAFIPITQVPVGDFTVMLRVAEDPMAAVSHLRSLVRELDPDLPVYRIRTLDSVLGADVAQPRFAMFLAGVLSGVALILATVGIFGALSYTVAQRTHEIGIRMALGAEGGRVVSLVLKQGVALVALALAVGLPLAWALTRTMDSLLFEVGPADPVTLLGVTAGVVFSALLACYIPAARAASVSPTRAMRDE